ncbi:unnamed protein product [Cylindrotheca closterium]|uniref:Uncharacterized protein n=1 Tax=Cylindrotheca closterium TaxID=2856 RepID=A0AAD2CLF8_9STRA|nr:unnamed protein product [Cylindrotheca closterium]
MMKLMKKTVLTLAVICLSTPALTSAFVPVSSSRTTAVAYYAPSSRITATTDKKKLQTTAPFVATKTTQLHERKYQGTNDGTGRGIILQVIVFGITAWLFTIPPEFRRAYLCPADTFCQEEGSCTRECVTPDEWVSGIKDYYKNGGGIKWDFSIDPKTKASNQQKLDAILGNMNNNNNNNGAGGAGN